MNILVMSDSHGRCDRIIEALKKRRNLTDCIFHLGDGVGDLRFCSSYTNGVPVISVKGNHEDYTRTFLDNSEHEIMLDLDGYKLLLMHGHRLGVKGGYERAAEYAYERRADMLLFGHTHVPFEKYFPPESVIGNTLTERPMYVFNPGSIGERSFGIVELCRSGISMNHVVIE